MNTPEQIDAEDLTLFAMQLLPPEETQAVARFLEQNSAARKELARIQGDLAGLAMSTEMQAPPAKARARFMKAVEQERKDKPADLLKPPAPSFAAVAAATAALQNVQIGRDENFGTDSYNSSGKTPKAADDVSARGASVVDTKVVQFPAAKPFRERALPWVGWAVAAGLAVTTVDLYQQRNAMKSTLTNQAAELATATAEASEVGTARDVLSAMNDQTAKRVTLAKAGAPVVPIGRTTYSAEKGVLIFAATNMAPLNTYKVYELWLIPADGKAPVPVGTFQPDAKGYANLISTKLTKGVEAKAFGITVENGGGSKTPTLPILMSGA